MSDSPILEQIQEMLTKASSLSDAERKYWLDLLPTMNEVQLGQLKGILMKDQQSSSSSLASGPSTLEGAAQNFLSRWDSEKARAERRKRQQEEQDQAEQEEKRAEDLLKQLN